MASDKIQRNIQLMVLKWFFDRLVSLIGLLVVWPVLLIVAIMIKVKMLEDLLFLRRSVWAKELNCLLAISSGR